MFLEWRALRLLTTRSAGCAALSGQPTTAHKSDMGAGAGRRRQICDYAANGCNAAARITTRTRRHKVSAKSLIFMRYRAAG
jgi:hypothetical protein